MERGKGIDMESDRDLERYGSIVRSEVMELKKRDEYLLLGDP